MEEKILHLGCETSRYFAASLLALLVDLTSFSFFLRVIVLPWAIAATFAFVIGVVVAYFLSIRLVFKSRSMSGTPPLEFLTFLLIGILGLGITQAILWIGISLLYVQPELSKVAAAGFTFMVNYIFRKLLLFRERRVPTAPCVT